MPLVVVAVSGDLVVTVAAVDEHVVHLRSRRVDCVVVAVDCAAAVMLSAG